MEELGIELGVELAEGMIVRGGSLRVSDGEVNSVFTDVVWAGSLLTGSGSPLAVFMAVPSIGFVHNIWSS